MWVYMFIYNLYNIFPEFSLLGQPQNLTESEFDDNIANIHAVNNRNLHPAQRRIAQSQSQQPSTTPGTGEASTIQLTSDPTRPALPSNQAMIMSSGNEAQEVTQKCPMPDCQWTSYKTTDSSMLDACVKQLCLHVQLEHEVSASSPMTGGSRRGDKCRNNIRLLPN